MKIKQDYIGSQYHQVYFTFSKTDIQEIYQTVIDGYGLANANTKKEKKAIDDLVMRHIETRIIDVELTKLDVIPVHWKRYRYLNDLSMTDALVIICQFCILPAGLQIKLPSQVPNELLKLPIEEATLKAFYEQLFHDFALYQVVPSEEVDLDCLVTYDLMYVKDDFIINKIVDREIENVSTTKKSFSLFLKKTIGDEVVLDEDEGVVVRGKITKITKKVYPPLTDEIVSTFHFLGMKTVEQLHVKLHEILSFSTSVAVLLDFLAEYIYINGDVVIEDAVINHFWADKELPKAKKLRSAYIKDTSKEIIKEYLIWVINSNFSSSDFALQEKVREELEFDKVLFRDFKRLDDYQEYLNRHLMEAKVLQYCIDQNILELPK